MIPLLQKKKNLFILTSEIITEKNKEIIIRNFLIIVTNPMTIMIKECHGQKRKYF